MLKIIENVLLIPIAQKIQRIYVRTYLDNQNFSLWPFYTVFSTTVHAWIIVLGVYPIKTFQRKISLYTKNGHMTNLIGQIPE